MWVLGWSGSRWGGGGGGCLLGFLSISACKLEICRRFSLWIRSSSVFSAAERGHTNTTCPLWRQLRQTCVTNAYLYIWLVSLTMLTMTLLPEVMDFSFQHGMDKNTQCTVSAAKIKFPKLHVWQCKVHGLEMKRQNSEFCSTKLFSLMAVQDWFRSCFLNVPVDLKHQGFVWITRILQTFIVMVTSPVLLDPEDLLLQSLVLLLHSQQLPARTSLRTLRLWTWGQHRRGSWPKGKWRHKSEVCAKN